MEYMLLIIAIIVIIMLVKMNMDLMHNKKSQSVRYGKMTENFMPFLENYPYDYHNFRFLGNPIDGIQFNDNNIVFVEFKTGNSKLSEKQKKIKELVENKRIRFDEFRI